MAAGHVDRNVLASHYQQPGDIYQDGKTEAAIEVVAQQVDDNYDVIAGVASDMTGHKNAAVLDHPDKSVVRLKIADKAIGPVQVDDAAIGQSHHQDNGIPSRALPNDVIQQRHMSDNVVGSNEIQANAVLGRHVAPNSIGSQHMDAALLASAASLSTQAEFDKRGISMQKLGAKGDGFRNDTVEVQAVIDAAKASGKLVSIPPDTNFIINGDIWLPSNVTIIGAGETSKLTFQSGSLRGEKGGQRGFPMTNIYTLDQVPAGGGDYANITLTTDVPISSTVLPVNNTTGVSVGDKLYTFNNVTDAWQVLSDTAQEAKFNDPVNYPLAQMEIFTVLSFTANSITLDKQTQFFLPSGAPVRKIVGIKNTVLSNFKLVFPAGPTTGIRMEQANHCTFDKLRIYEGGIFLGNKCFNNIISECDIETKSINAINIDAFSSGNVVSNNVINYTHGNDTAILVQMSNNNTITGNAVTGNGQATDNEDGILVHARSYGNVVSGNTVRNAATAYGLFYGAFNNVFSGNTSVGCKIDLGGYYCAENSFLNNVGYGTGRGTDMYLNKGLSLYKCRGVEVIGNIIPDSCLMQESKRCRILDNRIDGKTWGLHIIGINIDAEHIISYNKIKAQTGIYAETTNFNEWNTTLPTLIENNDLDCTVAGIQIKYLYYVQMKNNKIKNAPAGIELVDAAGFSTIHDNKFINCVKGIDFKNINVNSLASVRGNTFYKATTPLNQWVTVPAFGVAGGMYGFTIYDLVSIVATRRWIYNNITTGQTGAANWTELA